MEGLKPLPTSPLFGVYGTTKVMPRHFLHCRICVNTTRKGGLERGEFGNEGAGGLGVDVPGRGGGGFAEFCAEEADFGGGMREQAGDLGFKSAGADDLAERGVGGEREQVAGDVEGAGAEGALVGFGLEAFRACDALAEQIEDGGADALVGGEEAVDGLGIELGRSGICSEIREIPAGFEEILIAGGAFLAVPAGLVDEDNGGKEAEALDGEGDVGEVGDGAVAVLKIKGVEELLGALGADFGKRLAHGERGAGVLGHGEGEDLRVSAVDGEDLSLVPGVERERRFTGHEDGLADRIRHEGAAARCGDGDPREIGKQNAGEREPRDVQEH